MKRKKLVYVSGGLVLATMVALVAGYAFFAGPDLSSYERFREPALLSMPSQKVLLVEATGVPAKASEQAFGALMSTYFKLPEVPRGPGMPAPRARWPKDLDTPPEQWLGLFAMPVPDSVTTVPSGDSPNQPQPRLATWEYGQVAQILHVGPYGNEAPTVERLRAFIRAQGLEISGHHEEEYLRGPGMFGKGDPERYYTLIRYPVRKAGN